MVYSRAALDRCDVRCAADLAPVERVVRRDRGVLTAGRANAVSLLSAVGW
jgi:hypothetical protein